MDLQDFLVGHLVTIEKVCCFVVDLYHTFFVNAFYKLEKVTIYTFVLQFSKKAFMPDGVKTLLEIDKTDIYIYIYIYIYLPFWSNTYVFIDYCI